MRYSFLIMMVAFAAGRAVADAPAPDRNIIPSWGDITLVYGPGTDAAMDTPQAMENMVRHWKGRGFTGVYLRTDLSQFPPGAIIRHPAKTQENAGLALFWHLVDVIMAEADPHESARKAGEKLGFEYWMFHPHIYSEGAPSDVGVDGPGRMIPWSYMRSYYQKHPEIITVDRQGNKQWMVPEYSDPNARADKAAEFAYMAKTYRPTGIIASMRSESNQLIDPPQHADQFGFNKVVVDEMKKLYGVDILTDPRFDWKSPGFKLDDPMLEKWRDLRGSHITDLYREIRQAMRKAAPKVQFAVVVSGDHVGPIMGNARLEWRKWIDEGIVDVLILPASFEATHDTETATKGYLTDVRQGKGALSTAVAKEYITRSKHPGIKVIQTGASSYFYDPPPKGADGWQCDAWYDVYHVAWYQRWQQWMKDLDEFGFIKFFDQNFDDLKVKDPGIAGAVGDDPYHPELQACPGVWYKVGDGTDGRPFVQEQVRRGNKGRAIAFDGKDLTAVHYSSPDRSLLTGHLDAAIVNGKAVLSYWVLRPTEKAALDVYFSGTAAYEKDVAVRIAPNTGQLSYANGAEWVESDAAVPVNQWFPITIAVDLGTRTYSAAAGETMKPICQGIGFSKPAERYITQHGVESEKIKVPSYRIFNELMFTPPGGTRERVYLDDVLVKWTPTLYFAKPGKQTLLDETFESAKAGSSQFGGRGDWRMSSASGSSPAFFIQNTTSYGDGVLCAQANGGGALVAELKGKLTPASARSDIIIDLDFFLRSDKSFPFIIPDPTTKSPHSFALGLKAGDKPLAVVDTTGGTWRLWDGTKSLDTGKLVTYDVWNHLQIAIDPQARTYRLVVQPIGELPTEIGQAACGEQVQSNDKLKLSIEPSATAGHISCYDNIVVTCN